METNAMNIFQRLSAITSEMKTVNKKLEVDMGNGKTYNAVGERDVIDAIKPLESKYGVYSYPVKREIIDSKIIVTTGKYGDKQQQFLRLSVTYRFVNIDLPTEFIDIESYGDGVDSQDKAPGKAMTYADKYALLKAYKVATGEDTDQEPSQELKSITEVPMISDEQVNTIRKLYKGREDKLASWLEKKNFNVISDMPYQMAADLIKTINARKNTEIPIVQEEPKQEKQISLDDIV